MKAREAPVALHNIVTPFGAVQEPGLLRPQLVGQGVHGKPGGEPVGVHRAVRELLVVDEQQAVRDLNLVRVRPRRRGPLGHQLRPQRVGGVEDRRPHPAGADVTHVNGIRLPDHLHAVARAAEVMVSHEVEASGASGN
jgi:hypothetical protein